MRLWTLHPKYLDPQGLTALWREALLAQKVLQGKTRGYRHHPQLIRFRNSTHSLTAIAAYLHGIVDEAEARGYSFQRVKIIAVPFHGKLTETRGQLQHEWKHLLKKLARRSPAEFARLNSLKRPVSHPLFRIVPGTVQYWEKSP